MAARTTLGFGQSSGRNALIRSFRTLARRAVHGLGYERIHRFSFFDLMRHEGVQTLLDVGANKGHFGVQAREGGFKGRIASFEPISSVFRQLEAKSAGDELWDAFKLGVGNRDEDRTITIASASVFSSLKATSAYTAGKFVGAQPAGEEVVTVTRLDTFIKEHPELLRSTYLKIDTQGFEKEVLEGCGSLLPEFKAIQLELPIRQLYQDQESWLDMVSWMGDRGFKIAMAMENGIDWQAMRLLELDIVFVRT